MGNESNLSAPEQVPADLASELLAALEVMVDAHGYVSYCTDEEKEAEPYVIAARTVIAKAKALGLGR